MSSPDRKPKKLLTAEQKYDLWVRKLAGQVTQAQAAAEAGVDRSVISRLRAVARDGAIAALGSSKPGRPRQSRRCDLKKPAHCREESETPHSSAVPEPIKRRTERHLTHRRSTPRPRSRSPAYLHRASHSKIDRRAVTRSG